MDLRLRLSIACGFVVALMLLVPPPAAAQRQEPAAGSIAIGGDVGWFVADEEFNVTFTPQAYVEFYPLDRVSFRLLGGWTRPTWGDGGGRGMSVWKGAVSASYNWEAGYWHPFVNLGIGLNSIQYIVGDDVLVGRPFRRTSINAGVGIEYFWRPKITVKFEANYYYMRTIKEIAGSPSGAVLSIGVKRYF